MDPTKSPESAIPLRTAAFAVHVFTACGAACALLALVAAVSADWPKMFVWLGIALIIDGVDGTFARRLRTAGLLPPVLAIPLGALIVVTGSLYFADRQMKTTDYYFRGFPALWNVAAFYLFLLKLPPWLGALAVVALAALTFVPIHVVRPIRISHLRAITIMALIVWALLAVIAVADGLAPGFWTVAALCALAIYFVGIGFLRRHHPG